MFTGIVEELGRVKRITQGPGAILLELTADQVLAGTKIGDSIAVNGVCLTVVAAKGAALSFEIIPQTLKTTNLHLLQVGRPVNLERSLRVGDRVSGHFVSGHIDCLGLLRRKLLCCGSVEFEISVPAPFMRYCLPKGSVAVDGVSLTLAKIRACLLTVCVIPHTLKNTTLNSYHPSAKLNIEFDMLAKRNPL